MGVSYRGSAVIGCEVTGKTKQVVTVRACSHAVQGGAKFCAECGQPTTRLVEEPLTGLDEALTKVSLGLYYTTDQARAFAGVGVLSNSYSEANRLSVSDEDLAAVRVKVRSSLEPLGLWDEDSFGLWSVLYCSY